MGKQDSKPVATKLTEPVQTTLPLPMKDDAEKRETVVGELMPTIAGYIKLRANHKMLVNAIADDFLSEKIRSDRQLAIDLGVSRATVSRCKKNPVFVDVIGAMMPDLVKLKLPKVLMHAVKHAGTTYKAAEFLARFSGVYVPKSQQANLNVNVRAQTAGISPQAALETMVDKFIGLGWSPERICQSIIDYTKSR